MHQTLKRLSIRSVDSDAIQKLQELGQQTRLPMALLIEDGIEMLWQSYLDEGYDLPDPQDEA